MRFKKPIVGDCFEIPLADGRFVYGQYVYYDNRPHFGMGTLIQIFNYFSDRRLEFEDFKQSVMNAGSMFPPVFVGLYPAIRSGRWRILGNVEIKEFEFPKFRSTFGTNRGTYHDWMIWDGQTMTKVGALPVEFRSLELRQVWGAEGLEERIIGGKYRGDEMF